MRWLNSVTDSMDAVEQLRTVEGQKLEGVLGKRVGQDLLTKRKQQKDTEET